MPDANNQPGAGDEARFVRTAQRLLRDGRPGDAVRLLTTTIRTDPKNGILRFHLACAMQAAGRVVESCAMHELAVSLLPGRAEPLVAFGRALERARQPNEAVDALDGESQLQIFLHYVRQNGPHAHLKFDRRPCLGAPEPAGQRSHDLNQGE